MPFSPLHAQTIPPTPNLGCLEGSQGQTALTHHILPLRPHEWGRTHPAAAAGRWKNGRGEFMI